MLTKIIKAPFRITRDARILFIAFSDQRTPLIAKFLTLLTLGYLVSPIDLVPDFIPFVGWIDDLVIVPFLMMTSLKTIPEEIINDSRKTMIRMKILFCTMACTALLLIGYLLIRWLGYL
jgi:uncharacterized membrane protein YkvA (DUF1232 family)